MQSYKDMFSELYYALKKDICAQYPSIDREIEKDLVRLHRSLDKEGLSFITITHLALCDFFQKSLAIGAFADLPDMPRPRGFGRKSSKDVRPAYLHGLISAIFDEDGKLMSDPDVTAIAFVRQWLLMAKKVEVDCDDHRTEAALNEFLAIDARLPDHHPGTWDHDDPLWTRRTGHPLWGTASSTPAPLFGEEPVVDELNWDLYRSVCDRITTLIGVFDPWSSRPKHGPGAVADANNPMKYDFTDWPRKLQQYFPWDYFASHDFGLTQLEQGREPGTREFPSVVLAVPKTQKGPRIICKEPIAHQWIQGAVQRFLEERVSHTVLSSSISFDDQRPSQEMALSASFDGSLSTVDLSAASDRISTRLVEYLFSAKESGETSLLDALHASRSRYFVLGSRHERFRKFAPMGSACTFPVQSILFLSYAVFAILQTRQMPIKMWMNVLPEIRVFGDDIIIPTDSIEVLYSVLSTCGLKVNVSKSYTVGLFRESCGMDAYAGWDVTPAYIKHMYSSSQPSSLKSVVDTTNNLFRRGYWHTAAALLKTVPQKERKLLPVGYEGDGAVSLYSFTGRDLSHLKVRWNDDLHRESYSALTLVSKQRKRVSDGAAGLIQFFTEEPDPDSLYESGQVMRTTTTKDRRWI